MLSNEERGCVWIAFWRRLDELFENAFARFFQNLMCARYPDFVDVRTHGNPGIFIQLPRLGRPRGDRRRDAVHEATVLFSGFARRLYGDDRVAYLRFEAGGRSLGISTHIDSDDSAGINSMVIFCFDLAMSVVARRAGRAPGLLVHDSHLFDGVDDRQLAAGLSLAAEVTAESGVQYLVTMNSDDLAKARRRGFDAGPNVMEQRLTDRFEDGGLFGIRF